MKIFFLLLTLLSTLSQAETSVLFIGNSYTGQIKKTLMQLNKHEGNKIHMEFVTPGGCTLKKHFENQKTLELLKSRPWTYVVLQEQSQTPAYKDLRPSFLKASKQLNKIISAQGSKTLFYLTWGRRDGDKQNLKIAPDYTTMQKMLTTAYTQAAKEANAELAPVGLAWQEVRKTAPELGQQLYKKDGSHPSAQGAYLASLVLYCKILDLKASELSFKASLSNAEIQVIKRATQHTLED